MATISSIVMNRRDNFFLKLKYVLELLQDRPQSIDLPESYPVFFLYFLHFVDVLEVDQFVRPRFIPETQLYTVAREDEEPLSTFFKF